MDYTPAPHVLDHLKQVRLVAVVGPTAAGKNTVIEAAMARDPQIRLLRNNTSRERRPGESDREYRFLTREAMEARMAKGEYVLVAPSIFGDYYATAPEDYSPNGVMALPILAVAVQAYRALPFKSFQTIYIMPPDYATWRERIRAHNFTPAALQSRLAEAESSLAFVREDETVRIIINETIEQAADDFIALVGGSKLSTRLQADQSRGRNIAADLLQQLQADKR